jgi:tripartite-type tricarboxylate transporter receptor subunit TctC
MNQKRMTLGTLLGSLGLAFACLTATPVARAENPYPARYVTLLVPYAPGGTTDIIARQFAERLAQRLGQPVVVTNRPGAATNIAAQALHSSKPDGYTLLLVTNQLILNSVLGPVLPFDPVDVFSPVGMVAEIPYGIGVDAKSSITSVADFVAAGRKKEPAVSHAQFEPQMRLLSTSLGIPILGVPYQGGAPAVTAAIGGEVTGVLTAVSALNAQVKGGRLRLIGVSSSRRVASFPDVPTFAEQGFPKFTNSGWLGVLAPKGTPTTVLQRLSDATLAVVRDPAFAEALAATGAQAVPAGPAEALARMKAEQELWRGLKP